MNNMVIFHPSVVSAVAGSATPSVVAAAPATQPPVVRSIAVQNSFAVARIDPAILHLQNPDLAGFGDNAQGSPRTSFTLPVLISPVASPADRTLFEEPQDGTKKHYLPVFGIAATQSEGGPVKWVSFEPKGTGYQLTVHLTDVTDPSVAAPNSRQDASARYLLTANLQGRVASWDFQSAIAEGATLKLILALPDFGSRDAVYHAMTDPAAQAKLIIRWSLTLALPVPSQPSPEFAPVRADPAIYRFQPMYRFRQPIFSEPPVALYRQATIGIDSSIPFTFDPNLDKNVFGQLTGVSSGLPPWNIVRVNWNGRPYAYYQDRSQPSQIYFLPEAFKISRGQEPPHKPRLVISTSGNDANSLTVTLSYLAEPVWNPNRLAAAADALKAQLSLDTSAALALFEASNTNTTLSLKLPADDPSAASALVPQTAATIDTAAAIQGSVTLKLPQFRQVYDALFDDVSELLSGQVAVKVDDDVETIPFTARASDFAGDIFDIKTQIDAQSNRVVVILRNSIESPIHIDDLPALLKSGTQAIATDVKEISPALPIDLLPAHPDPPAAPAGSVTVTLRPGTGQSVDASCSPLFDFTATHVVPDPKAIWKAIVKNQVVGPVTKLVTVKLPASLFTPTASTAAATSASLSAIMAVQVVFEDGQTATFDATLTADAAGFLNQKVSLAVPIEAYILQESVSSSYRYHVDLISRNGPKTGDWVSDNREVLFVSVN
jgi:hypothetical protein